jgi:hypothetical protein
MVSPSLICQRCGKKLSRKRARIIDGEIMCSPCMFAPRKSGVTRMGGDGEAGSVAKP